MVRVMFLGCVLGLLGCGGSITPAEPKGYRESVGTVVPLTGKITLDGVAPDGGVSIAALKADLINQEVQQQKSGEEFTSLAVGGVVKPDGAFVFTTFDYADGLPAGEYVLLFRRTGTGGDKAAASKVGAFNKKYANPETSKHKVTLEAGKPLDVGAIELSTK